MSAILAALCGSWLVISPAATVVVLRRRTEGECRCPDSQAGVQHYGFCQER
jgi:hypothetical protein